MTKARDLANAADVLDDVSATELSYVNGVTSAIQTQLDAKVAKSLVDAKGDLLVGSANDTVSRLAVASTAGYLLTVDSSTDTGLKWVTPSTPTAQGVSVYNSTSTNLTDGSYVTLTFNTESFDTDGFHSTSTNTSRLTVPTGLGGKYLVNFSGRLNINASDATCIAKLTINGSDKNRFDGDYIQYRKGSPQITSIVDLVAGDYVEVLVYITGTGRTIETSEYGQFAMYRIGA